MSPPAAAPRRDRGAVTAEVAVLLPALVALLLVLLATAQAGVAALQVGDAARAAARAAAVGEPDAMVERVAAQLAGPHVQVTVASQDGLVVVSVARPVPGLLGAGGAQARATARAWPEP